MRAHGYGRLLLGQIGGKWFVLADVLTAFVDRHSTGLERRRFAGGADAGRAGGAAGDVGVVDDALHGECVGGRDRGDVRADAVGDVDAEHQRRFVSGRLRHELFAG